MHRSAERKRDVRGTIANGPEAWFRDRHPSPHVATVLGIAQSQSAPTRLVRTFLAATQFTRTTIRPPGLLGNILLAALEGFLAQVGYDVEGSIEAPEYSEPAAASPPRTRAIEIAVGETQVILEDALLFVCGPDGQRAVLSVGADKRSGAVELTHCSKQGTAQAFFKGWHDYAMQHAYLRGKRFYASGELVQCERLVRLDEVELTPSTRKLVSRLVLGFPKLAKQLRQRGLPAKRGLLLEGPPGTGKTMLCRALCNEFPATFIWVTARHVQGPADLSAHIWALARMLQPTVVLLEDIDLYAESRDHSPASQTLGELMNQLDGTENNDGILTIATTNRLEVVEVALRNRPGRFDRIIHIGGLEDDDRQSLLRRHLQDVATDSAVLNRLVARTDGFTGAQVAELVKTLIELASDQADGDPGRHLTVSADLAERALQEVGKKSGTPIGFAAVGDNDT